MLCQHPQKLSPPQHMPAFPTRDRQRLEATACPVSLLCCPRVPTTTHRLPRAALLQWSGGTHPSRREANAQTSAAFSLLPWGSCLSPGPSPSRPGSESSHPAGRRQRDAGGTGTCQPGERKGVTREHAGCSVLSAAGLSCAYWGASCEQRRRRSSPATCTGFLTTRVQFGNEGAGKPSMSAAPLHCAGQESPCSLPPTRQT